MVGKPRDRKVVASDQGRRFIDAAREAGVSEDEAAFDRALGKIAKAPPPETVKGRKTKKPD